MNDEDRRGPEDYPEARRRRSLRFAWVWAIPIAAVIVSGWLALREWAIGPQEVVARFASAEGVSEGAPVRYRGLKVGEVETVRVAEGLGHVELTLGVEEPVAGRLGPGARVWIDRAALMEGELRGLISGPGVAIEPGAPTPEDGPSVLDGLDAPPVLPPAGPGRSFVLLAEEAGRLSRGAPVLHRGVEVGRVLGTSLNAAADRVEVVVFVEGAPAARVTEDAVFWRAGGVSASFSRGVEVDLPSPAALVSGAVAFAAPEGAETEPAEPGTVFDLHESRDAAASVLAAAGPGRRFVLLAEEGSGLSSGAPVLFLGAEVGRVVATRLDAEARRVEVGIVVAPEHAGLVTEDSVFWRAGGVSASLAGGPSAEIPPLPALLSGGIAFSTPRLFAGPPAEPGAVFALFESRERALAAPGGADFLYATRFPRAVGGLEPGTAVTLEGREVGRVTRVGLEVEPEGGALATVVGYTLDALAFDAAAGDAATREALRRRLNDVVANLVEAGMRASIKRGGLLSGGPTLDLVTIEGVEAAELALEREPPRIPPAPSG